MKHAGCPLGGSVTRRHFPGVWLAKRKHKKLGDAALGLADWRVCGDAVFHPGLLHWITSPVLQWIGLRYRKVCQATLSKEVRKDEEEAGEEDEDREGGELSK